MSSGLIELVGSIAQSEIDRRAAVGIISGTVVSMAPLAIKIDAQTTLPEQLLSLSALCRANIKTVHHAEGEENIIIWRGLSVGDKVNLLKHSYGYFVIDREGAY